MVLKLAGDCHPISAQSTTPRNFGAPQRQQQEQQPPPQPQSPAAAFSQTLAHSTSTMGVSLSILASETCWALKRFFLLLRFRRRLRKIFCRPPKHGSTSTFDCSFSEIPVELWEGDSGPISPFSSPPTSPASTLPRVVPRPRRLSERWTTY
ncbi:uncharacterized protein PV07_07241 [Cladophialophora immunda]|uniref:Uncharacterized protein n=1 Tax=Cladophialophora immunda TaxID=569365 RepID=A0A0D2C8X2_9EURO|nr:uncharacterized protein PV07_07241 [Cladophialophora immunda]KIW27508.1 hypothetical protein PV07_07241 [Cladophialophora immunda]